MKNIYQGETLFVEITVLDSEGAAANLLGAEAYFAYKNGVTDLVTKPCSIENNIIKTTLEADETAAMLGNYAVEVKLRDLNGAVDTILVSTLKVLKSIMPTPPI